MATLTLRKVHKNGNASYSQEGVRASVYVNKQMFADGNPPETIEFGAPNLAQPGQKTAKSVDPEVQAERERKAAERAAKAQERASKAQERARKAIERAEKAQARAQRGVTVRPAEAEPVAEETVETVAE